jgi:hypothetical protein
VDGFDTDPSKSQMIPHRRMPATVMILTLSLARELRLDFTTELRFPTSPFMVLYPPKLDLMVETINQRHAAFWRFYSGIYE